VPEDEGESWSVAQERLRGKFIDALSGYGADTGSEAIYLGRFGAICAASMPTRSWNLSPGTDACYERLASALRRLASTGVSSTLCPWCWGFPPSDAAPYNGCQDMLRRQAEEGPLVEPEVAVLGAGSAAPSAPARLQDCDEVAGTAHSVALTATEIRLPRIVCEASADCPLAIRLRYAPKRRMLSAVVRFPPVVLLCVSVVQYGLMNIEAFETMWLS